jgi:hypothetical protein
MGKRTPRKTPKGPLQPLIVRFRYRPDRPRRSGGSYARSRGIELWQVEEPKTKGQRVPTIRQICDRRQRPAVRRVTAPGCEQGHMASMVNPWRRGMLFRSVERLVAAAVVVAVVLAFAVPFVLSLIGPFVGR